MTANAPTADGPASQSPAEVRVAASTRTALFGFRAYILYVAAGFGLRLLGGDGLPLQLPLLMIAVVAFWSWDQRRAVWIEPGQGSAPGAIVVRRRELWKLRERREVMRSYPPGTPVRYDASSAWWRVDHGLYVGDDRYAVLPEGRDRAERLARERQS